uniref:Uncharacterized protein n=1 Tax=Anopheles albimanus TaxID=7167 RepID=A0A182FZH9_ANOAL
MQGVVCACGVQRVRVFPWKEEEKKGKKKIQSPQMHG